MKNIIHEYKQQKEKYPDVLMQQKKTEEEFLFQEVLEETPKEKLHIQTGRISTLSTR